MKIKKLSIFFTIIISIFLLLRLDLIHLKDIDALSTYIQSFGNWAFLVYLLFCILASYIFFPLFMLRLIGIFIFGPIIGSALNILGSLIGAILSFFSARYLMGNFIQKKLEKNVLYNKINRGLNKHGGIIIFITRSNPLVSNTLQNYIYGLSDIKAKTYILWTILLYFLGTTSLALWLKLVISDDIFSSENIFLFLVALMLIIILVAVYYIVKKKHKLES